MPPRSTDRNNFPTFNVSFPGQPNVESTRIKEVMAAAVVEDNPLVLRQTQISEQWLNAWGL